MPITVENHAELINMAQVPGVTIKHLADIFGVKRQIVERWLKRPLGYVPRNGRPPRQASELIPRGDK